MIMSNSQHEVQVLSFVRGENLATVVTDGVRHKSFEFECNQDHPSLHRAIAYLESKGYSIVPDLFWTK